ncbi:MAG: MIP/aquaporin family protein [Bacteroidota bacterium]
MSSIFIAELIGTMLLILLGNGVVANVVLNETKGQDSGWVVITLAWGFAVFVGVAVAGPYSGAHMNPAVTIGLAVAEATSWSDVPLYISGQMVGAALGAFLVWVMYVDHYNRTDDEGVKLATFSTSPAIRRYSSNLISEIIGTFVLVFVVLYLASPELSADGLKNAKIGLGSIGALPVGLLVVVIGMGLGGTTGYAINPARDLGPRIMHAILPIKGKGPSDWAYAWIPVIGPIIGGSLAAMLYLVLKEPVA